MTNADIRVTRPGGFRADINGLRAVAVLAVLAFHFGVPGLRGGFIGVDIFFVISGFLMTGIVLGRLDRGSFSIPGFFLDRARRIIPALAVLLGTGLLVGALFLMPSDYFVYAKHAAASVLFLSNMVYWREGGYFDPTAESKWLLHTWSLSVEWQFYLLYPFILLVFLRILSRHRLWVALALAGAASFALMLWLSQSSPRSGFFLLPPRGWEMLAGGLVYLAPALPQRLVRAAQLTGLALIAAALLFVTEAGWPNVSTIAPVFGTALVILAARRDSRITGNPVATWVGLNSYSIYLWHWPLAVILRRGGHAGDWRWMVAAFAASFVLGHLSYRFVERGGTRKKVAPYIHTAPLPERVRPHLAFAVMVVLIAGAGAGVWKARGFPQRFSPEVQALQQDLMPGSPFSSGCFSIVAGVPAPCIVGPRKDRALVTVIGDSHADATVSAVVASLPANAQGGVAFNGYASCAPLLGGHSTDPDSRCAAFIARYLPPLTRLRATPVILIAAWDAYAETPTMRFDGDAKPADAHGLGRQIVRTGCALAKGGPTYMLLPTPTFPVQVGITLQSALVGDSHAQEITMPLADVTARNRTLMPYFEEAARSCGVKLLDPAPFLCPGGVCQGSSGHRAIVRDAHHLSEYGNKRLVALFAPVVAGSYNRAEQPSF